MDKKITLGGVIQRIVAYGLILVFLLAWPLQLIKQPVVSGSNDRLRWDLPPVYQTAELVHEFKPQFDYLESISFYINNEWEDGTYISITCYLFDQNQELVMGQEFLLDASAYPGYFTIPIEQYVDTSMNYAYLVHAQNEELNIVGTEIDETGAIESLKTYVNNTEQEQAYAVTTFVYKAPVMWPWIMAYVLCGVFFVGMIGMVEKLISTKKNLVAKYSQDNVVKILLRFTIVMGTIFSIYAIYPLQLFGKLPIDNGLYIVAILILSIFLLYVTQKVLEPTKLWNSICNKNNIKNYVQSFCIGMAFIQTCQYVNALYEYTHQINMRQMVVWLMLAMITFIDSKQFTKKLAWIFTGVGVCGGIGYYLYYGMGLESEASALVLWDAYQLCFGVILLFHFTRMLFTKKITKLSMPYLSMLVVMWTLLLIFDQGRTWVNVWFFPIGLFYGMIGQEEDTTDFLLNFKNGIIISFLWMVGYCLIHRPFHYYIYTRYSMHFHTVTIASMYLVLVCIAVFIGVLYAYKKGNKLEIITYLFLLGMSTSYLIFTISRTGIFSILIVGSALIVCMVWFGKIKHRRKLCIQLVTMVVAIVLSFPVWFTLTRIVPAVVNDPVYTDFEESVIGIALIEKGEELDSEWYITIEKFLGYSENRLKVQTQEENVFVEDNKSKIENSLEAKDMVMKDDEISTYTVEKNSNNLIPEEGNSKSTYTNGRTDIWKYYLKELNWEGHKEMGFTRDDVILGHAHNSFLQLLYDHGILTGIFFCIFYLITVFRALFYYLVDTNAYKRLVALGIIGAFGVVSLAEWAIHPCIPIGFAFLMSIAPLMKKIEAE